MKNQKEKKPKPGSVMRLLWRNHPWLTFFTLICGVISGVASIAVVSVINQAIHNDGDRMQALYWFAGLSAIALILRNGAALFPAYASMRIMTRLRIALCRKILATPLEEVDRRGPPNVLTMLTNDIPQLNTTLIVMPTVLVEATVFLFGIAYLAYLSWVVLALTVSLMVLGVGLYLFFFASGVRSTNRVRDEFTAFNEYTHALVFGLKELKLNGIRRRWFGRSAIEASSTRVARYNFVERLWYTAADNVGQFTLSLLIGCLLFAAPLVSTVDPKVMTASVLAVLYIMGPLSLLVGAMPVLAAGRVACTRLAEFGFAINDPHPEPVAVEAPKVHLLEHKKTWGSIELKGVRMHYQDPHAGSGFSLGPIDLTVQAGELIYIVGGNGCGKSTLAKVLCGLYIPQGGEVLLDGVAISDESRSEYRDLFSAVFSDFHLFNRLIGPDEEDGNPELASKYLETLGLADKIKIEGLGYSTLKALSYGQQKRLALVCAYMEDRPVYVLDEWAADQDPPFKKFFYEELLPDLKRRGKTVLIITHDDQYFQLADRIIKLADGHIVSDINCAIRDKRA
ncbi:cyclic peptide export ABC transporter [Pseudomonas corrugata]|uniref:Cyclic peptide export ABC transporter n=1 Tax=Pseudomonas corrugata TaxID=47879 RepID=A0A8B6UJH6_9PSED|nr:cyclic peptide export ABC transporter [Pseudomonas corrugata]AOE60909.1 ATP-binding protein [Pseudomonas corrugata]MDU9026029.1 cyclic peptide export ABC transporter [Pseudomonas corrugata]MDU9035695.1 cyclic peptide export ABC transporter [Pseudomonas corrugata]MDU9042383.1 cyclic peptide export ABC transporter [Pseudomonas corrugata]QTH12053.1 cyclic peptide export ABC transporter [Pseudomonas corrugata]